MVVVLTVLLRSLLTTTGRDFLPWNVMFVTALTSPPGLEAVHAYSAESLASGDFSVSTEPFTSSRWLVSRLIDVLPFVHVILGEGYPDASQMMVTVVPVIVSTCPPILTLRGVLAGSSCEMFVSVELITGVIGSGRCNLRSI